MHRFPQWARLHIAGIKPKAQGLNVVVWLAVGANLCGLVYNASRTTNSPLHRRLIRILLTFYPNAWVYDDRVEPVVAAVVSTCLLMEGEASHATERLGISVGNMAMPRHVLAQHGELTTAYARAHVRQTVVITHVLMLIIWITLASYG